MSVGGSLSDADDRLLKAILARDIRSAARLITRVENGDTSLSALLKALYARGGHAEVVGLTGPPGVGKSTMADQLIHRWRQAGRTVGVLAIDPSSPITQGALLGDRLRMGRHDEDAGVFIRSMAARGMLGGLSGATQGALAVLDAMGWDIILLETVGVGQNEVDVSHHAACVVLLQTAGAGDAVQASKAGFLETGDVFVVNKADMDGTDRTVSALWEMLGRRADHGRAGCWQQPVLRTVASKGEGIAELVSAIDGRLQFLRDHPDAAREHRVGQLVGQALASARETLATRMRGQLAPRRNEIIEKVLARQEDPSALLRLLLVD